MSDDPYDMRANSVYKLREELAFALTERDALRAENARLEKAVIELTEENRLVGLQMDRFADEIERLREALKNARAEALKEGAEIAFAYNGMPRSEIAQAFARAAMGESDDKC